MISYSTEFPVDSTKTSSDFLSAVKKWITGSPHTQLTDADIGTLDSSDALSTSTAHESIESLRLTLMDEDSAAVRYSKFDGRLEWTTITAFSRKESDTWVSVRVSCESRRPSSKLPPAKKPVLVRVLLESLGGQYDGSLLVHSTPVLLNESDIFRAANCMNGSTKCRLPIVYLSMGFHGKHAVDPQALAKALFGMAHVVAEPSRTFSTRLMIEVAGQNAYGGAIGVYWPDGGGRRTFFIGPMYATQDDLAAAVVEEITAALANRLPLSRCTLASVQERVSRYTYQHLKQAGSTQVNEYIAQFDREVAAKDEQLKAMEREVHRMRSEVRKYEARFALDSGLSLRTGTEQDLRQGEMLSIVCDAIRDATGRVRNDSRRFHVLDSIAKANSPLTETSDAKVRLKELLRGYKRMDSRTRQGLEELGFEITDDGKHYKLVYQGDDRYTFTLSKTGSDSRGGLNAASDISNLLF